MASAESLEPCPDCGALFPPSAGPTHRYIGASAGCWALYAALCAGQQPDAELVEASRVSRRLPSRADRASDASIAALMVDAYAARHHGVPSPQAVQSVAVHLLVLHGVCRRGQRAAQAHWIRHRALRTRRIFHWLT